MKIFIALSESPLKVRKIVVYRFLISFLVPELLRFKDLKNYQTILCLGKYLSKSFETLKAEITRHYAKDL